MTTPYEDDQDDATEQGGPDFMRKLRSEAKTGRDAQKAIDEANAATRSAQRELAMARAGIDVASPLGTMFARAYDGEVDVDLIKSEWDKVQPGSGGQPQVGVSPADQAAMERISQAQAGGVPAGGAPHDFESELDSIPMYVDTPQGKQQNPDYVNQVLAKTAEQAAREGRQFSAVGAGARKWSNSASGSAPAVNPL